MKKVIVYTFFFSALLGNQITKTITDDFYSYKKKENLYLLGGTFLIGGIIANTSMDVHIHDFYQNRIRNYHTDFFLKFAKKMGQDEVLLAYGLLGSFALLKNNSYPGRFASRLFQKSARAFIIGTIPLHITRTVTGGCRPSTTKRGSSWIPFTKPQGVSGHTYTGAILFINCAQMTENMYIKFFLYSASTLTGISRINDNCHYPSQAFLGWMMAYIACNSVKDNNSIFNSSISPNKISFAFEF